ncbi:MAG: hypothetical protein AAB075_09365, partial [Gemmatimonadota bacterium]
MATRSPIVQTIETFILDQERRHPAATGELTNLLYDIALGTKLVAAAIRRAGLVDILGSAGETNIQGEEQQKLDVYANDCMKNALAATGRVCVLASEEDEQMTTFSTTFADADSGPLARIPSRPAREAVERLAVLPTTEPRRY